MPVHVVQPVWHLKKQQKIKCVVYMLAMARKTLQEKKNLIKRTE